MGNHYHITILKPATKTNMMLDKTSWGSSWGNDVDGKDGIFRMNSYGFLTFRYGINEEEPTKHTVRSYK